MSKYTCNEKLSEKKMSSSTRKKVLGMFLGGVMALSSAAGLAWGAISGELDKSNDVKEMNIPFAISMGTNSEPSYSNYMNKNIDAVNKIKREIIRYQELLQMPNHSDRHKLEIEKLEDKIVNTYGKAIESFALNIAKTKLADAHHISPHDIEIRGSVEDQIFVARDKENNKKLLNQDSPLLVADVINDLIHIQNNEPKNDFDKTVLANSLSTLFIETGQLGNQTLFISKNGKLAQANINELSEKQNSKDDEFLR